MGRMPPHLCEIHHIGKDTREFLIHPAQCPALRRHRMILAGISMAASDFQFARPQPQMFQILIAFRGMGRVWLDKWVRVRPGAVYVTPPGVYHAYEAIRGWEIGWVIYENRFGASYIKKPELREIDPLPLECILRGLHREASLHQDLRKLESWADLLHDYSREIISPAPRSRLRPLWELVRMKPAQPWSLDTLALSQGIGPEQLRRLCHQETGYSPMQYVARLRMEAAVYLLRAGYKVEAAAHAVGYENSFAFSVAFKRIMGNSPSRF